MVAVGVAVGGNVAVAVGGVVAVAVGTLVAVAVGPLVAVAVATTTVKVLPTARRFDVLLAYIRSSYVPAGALLGTVNGMLPLAAPFVKLQVK